MLSKKLRTALLLALLLSALLVKGAYAALVISNGMPATLALGQTDFTSTTSATTQTGLNRPYGVAVDPTTGKLFVADWGNHRVLRYASAASLATGAAAEAVLGQPDFTSNQEATTQNGMSNPMSLDVDTNGRLWVADTINSRVLRFDAAATKTNGAHADGVLGQPDFTSNDHTTTQSGMWAPFGLAVDSAGRLWVADTVNNRVLRFDDAAGKTNGADADGVLGQINFTSQVSAYTQSGLNYPYAVALDSAGHLWLADGYNNRVLRFDNAASKANGANADSVLGKLGWPGTFGAGQGQISKIQPMGADVDTQFRQPMGVDVDTIGRLWVADNLGNRVLVFNNAASLGNGATADNVLGQPNFDPYLIQPTSATSLNGPTQILYDEGAQVLFVVDSKNNRVLVYGTPTTSTYTISGTLGANGAGGMVNFSGGSTLADSSTGAYSFTVPAYWSGTVTPAKVGWTFSPVSKIYANVLSNQVAQDYTASAVTYTISGDAGVGGATLSYTDGAPKIANADGSGLYSFPVSYNWSGTVTPSKTGYDFTPASKTYSNIESDKTGENYSATIVISSDTSGVFRPGNGALFLKNDNTTGIADIRINYGNPGDYPVVGDWDGNRSTTIGIYRNGMFYLRNSNQTGVADFKFAFGAPGDQPIAGDWDGDGVDTVGVYRSATGMFYLLNSNSSGPPDLTFRLGGPGDVAIAGDWTGKGYDTVGVFRPSNGALFLKNANTTGVADIQINYGLPGDRPITGDWDGNGTDTIGVYRAGKFLLRNSNTIGVAELSFFLGVPGDVPIAGNWDGSIP